MDPLILVVYELSPMVINRDGQAKDGVSTVAEVCELIGWIHINSYLDCTGGVRTEDSPECSPHL